MNVRTSPAALLLLGSMLSGPSLIAQSNNYTQTNLVSDVPGLGLTTNNDLQHPWGMAVSPNQAFRISANQKGQFRSFNPQGDEQDPRGVIAVPQGVTVPANPTGVVANTTGLFQPPTSPLPSPFLFATRQGTISAEYADGRGDIATQTILVADHSSQGAEYTSLAILTPDCCAPFLAVSDFHRGFIETFTSFFAPLGIPGAFTDPNLPPGFAPWYLNVVGSHVFVAYAVQDAVQHDPVFGGGNGLVDIYNLDGTFVRRFATDDPLNVPSGIVQAGPNFGAFSNDILIGNLADGVINAFDPTTGHFLGSLKDGNGTPLMNRELHSLFFGDGITGDADTLYVTAAPGGGATGLFAAIAVNTSGMGPDFSLTPSSSNVTVPRGQPGIFTVKAAPAGSFRGTFTFSCNAPSAITCTIGSPTVDPATGASTVQVTATPTLMARGLKPGPSVPFTLSGVLLAALGLRRRLRKALPYLVPTVAVLLLLTAGIAGCGGKMQPQPTTQSLSITAFAGSVSHTAVVNLTVQ